MMIELEGVQKIIHSQTVIDISDLNAGPGEVIAVIGPVGSGKGVLLDLLTGKTAPSLNEVCLAGIHPHRQAQEFSRRVGVLFAENNLYARMSVEENLKFFARMRRLPFSQVQDVLKRVGLLDHARVRAAELPSSLQRRLAFGRAILHDPQVLLLEEPFARCDASSVTLLGQLIHDQAETGGTVLILAEDSIQLQAVSDRIYRLKRGRVVEVFEPRKGSPAGLPFMIPARQEGKIDLVAPADIYYVAVQMERTYLHTEAGAIPTQFTLAELEERLNPSGFFRTHRSYLVNLQHVSEVIPFTRDSYSLRLKDAAGTQIPLSKSAARTLRLMLGY